MWTQQEPPAGGPAAYVTATLGGAGGDGERVLARADAPVRPADVVLACRSDGVELRRVGRVRADAVELLGPAPGSGAVGGEWVDARVVLGTLLLRWESGTDDRLPDCPSAGRG